MTETTAPTTAPSSKLRLRLTALAAGAVLAAGIAVPAGLASAVPAGPVDKGIHLPDGPIPPGPGDLTNGEDDPTPPGPGDLTNGEDDGDGPGFGGPDDLTAPTTTPPPTDDPEAGDQPAAAADAVVARPAFTG